LIEELGPPSKLSGPAELAFAVETVVESGAALDRSLFDSALAASTGPDPMAASTYVLALAARSGHADPKAVAAAIASECSRRLERPPSAERDYFLAASMAALPNVSPVDCSAALAEDLLSRQQFEGFWPPEAGGGDKARATGLALLALAKLLSIG
jgi:hypothetical protein